MGRCVVRTSRLKHFGCLCSCLVFLTVFSACMRIAGPSALQTRVTNAGLEWECLSDRLAILPCSSLTLEELVSLALERNLDLLVKNREYSYQHEQTTGARLRMLPAFTLTGELSGRNRNTGMFSKSLDPTVPPAPPSISLEEHVNRYDLTFTWNLLDFGISYFRSQQESHKIAMRQAEYLRARQMLITSVCVQYWRARVSGRGMELLEKHLSTVASAIERLEAQIDEKNIPKDVGLRYQASLMRLEQQLQLYRRNYHDSMYQLAKLVGASDVCFTIAEEEFPDPFLDLPPPCELAELALLNRPELFGLDAEEKIKWNEANIAAIQLFPGLSTFAGYNFDSNFYLIYHNWMIAGIRYAWNLLAIPIHLQEMLANSCDARVTQVNRLAVSVGILTQLNLACLNYCDTRGEYLLAQQMADIKKELAVTMERRCELGEISKIEFLATHQLDALVAEVDALKAFGDQMNALEQINNSIGIPFYLNDSTELNLEIID